MAKNTKIVSLSLKPEQDAILLAKAKKLNVPKSEVARRLVDDFVELSPEIHRKLRLAANKREVTVARVVEQMADKFPIDDDSVKAIILKIPLTILGNKDNLKKWLAEKSETILTHLYPS